MPRKKESSLPSLEQAIESRKKRSDLVLPPPLSHNQVRPQEKVAPTPEEPKFYGEEFAFLTQTDRKTGTLRTESPKRAGLVKGLRIMGHFHAEADAPSIVDIPLVILDVYHGPIKEIVTKYPLSLLLDGINGGQEAVNVLQKFYQNITPKTRADYFTYIREAKFNALSPEDQQLLLSLPTEKAITHPKLSHLFLPALCQTALWHGADLRGWLNFLIKIKIIDKKTAERIYNFPNPGWDTDNTSIPELCDEPDYGLQSLLEEYDPKSPTPLYELVVLCRFPKVVTPVEQNMTAAEKEFWKKADERQGLDDSLLRR